MKADNYARNIFIIMAASVIMTAFLIGMATGVVIYEVCDSINAVHRTNIMVLYEGEK